MIEGEKEKKRQPERKKKRKKKERNVYEHLKISFVSLIYYNMIE